MNTNPQIVIPTVAPALRGRRFFALGLFLLVWAAGCNQKSETQEELVIFAPASMIDVLPKIAQDWTEAGNPPVRFRFDATSRLARQIEHGAPADLFVSADRRWMNNLVSSGDITPASVVPMAQNTLVAITHRDNPVVATKASDLQKNEVSRIVLAGAQVPVGRYARRTLKDKGVLASIQSKIIAGTNARHVLTLIERGEGDVAFVYATDARSSNTIRVLFSLPPDSAYPIEYLGGVVRGADKRAQSFLQFLQSDTAQKTLLKAGFLTEGRRNP